MVERVDTRTAEFASGRARFEAGTQNIAGVIGLAESIRYLEHIGLQNIERHVQELVAIATLQLGDIPGVRMYNHADARKNAGVVSFLVEGIYPHDVAEILLQGWGCGAFPGHHCAQPLMSALRRNGSRPGIFYLYRFQRGR